jgi:carboxyl-terminal processing protease
MWENYRMSLSSVLAIAIVLALLSFGFGLEFGAHRASALAGAGAPAGVDLAPVWKAWNVIDEKFVPASVASTTPVATTSAERNQERVWGMIAGLADSLNDPYTYFLPPQENQQFSDDMSGQFQGVGMEIAVRDEVLTVVAPLKGTPAERAGIKSADRILKINGDDTKGVDVDTAIKKIRGPKGTTVTLTIARDGWTEPKDIKVTRDVINVPTVTTIPRADGVFVIELSTFTSNSPDLFRNALREFVQSGDDKLVLDLRGNPGGYLDAAVDMASWFLPSGDVVVTEDYAGHAQNIVHRSSGYAIFNKNLKMAILVDRGSASASEILADALRHYGIAKLIGTNTFGKGSVQELVDITPETSLKVTVARWLGPDGKQIPLTGITPDIEATITDEDVKAGKDPQLDRAVSYLQSQ